MVLVSVVFYITTCFNGVLPHSPSQAPAIECERSVSGGATISGEIIEGATSTYTCPNGYAPIFVYTVCQSNGTWDPVPSCIVECERSVFGGATISGEITEGATSTYTCPANGYVPKYVYTVCQSNGVWDPVPSCIVDCGSVSVQNGNIISGNTSEGASHHVTCAEGYVTNNAYTVCSSSGHWYPTPYCSFGGCGDVNISNGKLIEETTVLGTIEGVNCNVGYRPVNDVTTECSNNGAWNPAPACVLDPTLACFCIPSTANNQTLEEKVEYIIRSLSVDVDTLSSTRRQYTSAEDGRASAKSIGVSGVLILTGFWCIIILPDLINVVNFLSDRYRAWRAERRIVSLLFLTEK